MTLTPKRLCGLVCAMLLGCGVGPVTVVAGKVPVGSPGQCQVDRKSRPPQWVSRGMAACIEAGGLCAYGVVDPRKPEASIERARVAAITEMAGFITTTASEVVRQERSVELRCPASDVACGRKLRSALRRVTKVEVPHLKIMGSYPAERWVAPTCEQYQLYRVTADGLTATLKKAGLDSDDAQSVAALVLGRDSRLDDFKAALRMIRGATYRADRTAQFMRRHKGLLTRSQFNELLKMVGSDSYQNSLLDSAESEGWFRDP